MLALLTDEHISWKIAEQINIKYPQISIESLQKWRMGKLLRAADEVILSAAFEEKLTLVTYDENTIPSILTQWAFEGHDHAGVIFINKRTIYQNDFGGQVRALLRLWNETHDQDWTNMTIHLKLDI